ncbi:Small ribosomal subunit protein [Trichinella pseudospiralis]
MSFAGQVLKRLAPLGHPIPQICEKYGSHPVFTWINGTDPPILTTTGGPFTVSRVLENNSFVLKFSVKLCSVCAFPSMECPMTPGVGIVSVNSVELSSRLILFSPASAVIKFAAFRLDFAASIASGQRSDERAKTIFSDSM